MMHKCICYIVLWCTPSHSVNNDYIIKGQSTFGNLLLIFSLINWDFDRPVYLFLKQALLLHLWCKGSTNDYSIITNMMINGFNFCETFPALEYQNYCISTFE